MAANWPAVCLAITAVMLFRWQGDSWEVTMIKAAVLVMLFLIVVAVLGELIVRLL